MLIDTHAHLNFGAFKNDSQEIARQCIENGVWIINVGSQSSTSERAVKFANKFPEGVYAAVGLHPSHLFEMEVSEEEIEFESRAEEFNYNFYKALAQDKKVVAIGECGLDYHYFPTGTDREKVRARQTEVFTQHVELATELNLPVIVHARDTYEEIYNIVNKYVGQGKLKKRGVLHCYLGDWGTAEKFLDLGFMVSFTGIITFPPKKSQANIHAAIMEVVKNAPLDRIMVETDAPFLSPEPHRGERNLPSYVEYVARKIAEVKDISFKQVCESTTENARKFFKI